MVELSRMAALVTLLWTTHANLKLGMASIIITWVAAVGFFVFLRHFVSPVIGDCTHRMIHILRLLQKLLTIRIQRGSTQALQLDHSSWSPNLSPGIMQQTESSTSGRCPECFVIVHNVAKKHNIGTLARSCTAFNVAQARLLQETFLLPGWPYPSWTFGLFFRCAWWDQGITTPSEAMAQLLMFLLHTLLLWMSAVPGFAHTKVC